MLKRLGEVECFEYTLPFYRMRIDRYEGCIKRYVNKEDNLTVSIEQLKYAFYDEEPWADLQDDRSRLSRIFRQKEMKDSNNPNRLNVYKLICMGVPLCGGSVKLKARVLYDVL